MEELEQLRREKVILNDHLRQAQSLRTASADEKDAAISRLTAELEGAKAEVSRDRFSFVVSIFYIFLK